MVEIILHLCLRFNFLLWLHSVVHMVVVVAKCGANSISNYEAWFRHSMCGFEYGFEYNFDSWLCALSMTLSMCFD